MPNAFDISKYTTDFNPIAGGPFVSIQDVMSSFGDVFQEIIQLLPQLLNLIEQLPEEFLQIVETVFQTFINFVFPSDGSTSPLITALTGILTNVIGAGGSGGILQQLVDFVIQIIPQLISTLTSMIGTSGGSGLISQIVGMLISLLPDILTSITSLIGGEGGSGVLSQLISLGTSVLTAPLGLLSGFTGGSSILTQLIGAGGGIGTTLTDFANLFGLGGITSGLLGSGGLLSGFSGGTNILTQLIGAVGGSGSTLGDFANLFGGLGSLQTLLTGFTGGIPLLTQLISAGGGTGSTLTDFVNTFAGSVESVITALTTGSGLLSGFTNGSSILTQLPSLLTLPLTAISGFTSLFSGFDTSGSIPLLSQLPSLLTLPLTAITGLMGAGGLLSGFTSGSSILSQLPSLLTLPLTAIEGLLGGGGTTGLLAGLDTSGGTSILNQLPSLLSLPLTAISGFASLFSGFDTSGSLSLLTQLPSLLTLPLTAITGLLGGGGLLTGFTTGIPILTQLIGLFSGSTGGLSGLGGLGSIFTSIMQMLGNPTGLGGGSFNPIAAGGNMLQSVLTPAGALTTLTQLPAHLLGFLNTGQMLGTNAATSGNLLSGADPTFDDPTTLDPTQTDFVWDGTVDHTGKAGSGSARFDCDGSISQLFNMPISTKPGQLTNFIAYTRWRNLVLSGSGNAINLCANAYDINDNPISDPINRVLASIATPTASSVGWTGADADGWVQLAGQYTPPASTAYVILCFEVQSICTAGSVWVDDVSQAFAAGGIINASLLTEIESIPQLLPTSVGGILGQDTIGSSVQAHVDALTQVFGQLFGQGGFSLQNLQSKAQVQVSTASNALSIGQNVASTLTKRAVSKPAYHAIDPTVDATFDIMSIGGTAPTTVPVTSLLSTMGAISPPDGGVKDTIVWEAPSAPTGITGLFLNIFKLDPVTEQMTRVFQSPNIVGNAIAGTNYYNIPAASVLDTSQGEWYVPEMMTTGPGTYNIVGLPNHWKQGNPNTKPKQIGMARNTGTAGPSATSAGATGSASSSVTVNDSITAPAGHGVWVFAVGRGSTSITGITATLGGVSMGSPVAQVGLNNATNNVLYVFRAPGAGTGAAQAIQVVQTGSGTQYLSIFGEARAGVTGLGTIVTAFGSSTTPSVAPSSSPGNSMLTIMAAEYGSGTVAISAENFTVDNPTSQATSSASNAIPALVVGGDRGAGTTPLTATVNHSCPWAAISIPLLGTAATVPATITTPPYSQNVPWLGLGGIAGQPQIGSNTQEFSTAGDHTYNIPTQFQVAGMKFDIIVLGAGGGACGGGAGMASGSGPGGFAGHFFTITLTYGVDIPLGTTSFTCHVGAGGIGGRPVGGAGTAGGASSVTIVGYTGPAISAAGGAQTTTSTYWSSTATGQGAGTETYDGMDYPGGDPQTSTASPGISPGGAGSGGLNATGGNGADGAIWVMAHQ